MLEEFLESAFKFKFKGETPKWFQLLDLLCMIVSLPFLILYAPVRLVKNWRERRQFERISREFPLLSELEKEGVMEEWAFHPVVKEWTRRYRFEKMRTELQKLSGKEQEDYLRRNCKSLAVKEFRLNALKSEWRELESTMKGFLDDLDIVELGEEDVKVSYEWYGPSLKYRSVERTREMSLAAALRGEDTTELDEELDCLNEVTERGVTKLEVTRAGEFVESTVAIDSYRFWRTLNQLPAIFEKIEKQLVDVEEKMEWWLGDTWHYNERPRLGSQSPEKLKKLDDLAKSRGGNWPAPFDIVQINGFFIRASNDKRRIEEAGAYLPLEIVAPDESLLLRTESLADIPEGIELFEGEISDATVVRGNLLVEQESQSDVSQSPRDLKLLSAHSFLTKNAPEFQIHYESEEDSDGREEWIWLQYKNGDLRVRIYLALGRLCMEATLLSSHGEPASTLHNELTKEYMKGAKTSSWMNHYGLGGNECEIGFIHNKNFGDDFNEENLWQVVEVSLRELVEYRCRLDELESQ